ncbi:MarR family winged helix-turn-helix transcriptional regulator [Microbacterium gilvum]|uniref:MarR family winged helix-turn-helix transcriptional regulator n=1 Tax=Microbacterium gilvum TaxID=1336204 RepID=A0ABP8ZYU7_9MICO
MTETGAGVYDLDANDPVGALVDRAGLSPQDVAEIGALMNAMGRLRQAEQSLNEASLRYMKLNQTDMRALHYLIVAGNRGDVVTPGVLAAFLSISTASTTKLLDRLEAAGHIVRTPHPSDRRALTVAITPETRIAATDTIGRIHARRAIAAARLTSAERGVVTRFLQDIADELGATGFDES